MKKYKGIRYGFRPQSYWDDTNPLTAILRNVQGENRRQMIRDYWAQGRLAELSPGLLEDVADDEVRTRLGRIHPSFMGGEYLPGYGIGEVEIARICLQSTTADVISLRAQPTGTKITYRVVDEYQGEFELPIKESTAPLTLAELIKQFDKGSLWELDYPGGLSLGYNNMNSESGEYERLRHFTRITSEFYPTLEQHYENVFDEWIEERCAERDAEKSKEEASS
jgi:hypothetical protein